MLKNVNVLYVEDVSYVSDFKPQSATFLSTTSLINTSKRASTQHFRIYITANTIKEWVNEEHAPAAIFIVLVLFMVHSDMSDSQTGKYIPETQ